MNPNATSIGPATPMGRLYRLLNMSNEGEKGGEEDEKGEWVSGIKTSSSNNDGGDEDESSTPQPQRTPYDETLNGEGQGEAVSSDNKVGGSEDDQSTSYGDDERQCRREKARDEARDDEEGQQNRERGQTMEEHRMAAINTNDEDNAPPPQPPSPPTPPVLPPHPEQHNDIDHMKLNKMPA
ncbi:hypothetical protein PAXINDRAFT_21825 [Paxillus involutus ATCC 200175]|uniref:Uncharacterized protein n=1 Tax=Paxillus involutus ATCC 200175 TaxID=664439 RepID=A0A0C9T9G3_PAXIN|nr:hypothetical protein PAXINDRAFT_21825 [Paxillus involutus ATCC 200175]